MNSILKLILNPRTGAYELPRKKATARPVSRPRSRTPILAECPTWMVERFRAFKPSYIYSNGPKAIDLQRIEWWHDTHEWAGMYVAKLVERGTGRKLFERYVYVIRDGELVEIRQFGADPWRSRS